MEVVSVHVVKSLGFGRVKRNTKSKSLQKRKNSNPAKRPYVHTNFIEKMAALPNQEIAQYYAAMMIDDLNEVNESCRAKFGNFAPGDDDLYQAFIEFIIEYLNRPCSSAE